MERPHGQIFKRMSYRNLTQKALPLLLAVPCRYYNWHCQENEQPALPFLQGTVVRALWSGTRLPSPQSMPEGKPGLWSTLVLGGKESETTDFDL